MSDESMIAEALQELSYEMNTNEQRIVMPFQEFLGFANENPKIVFRSIFQSFASMVESFVGPGYDEYPGDPESINFVKYDTSKLLVEKSDHPFFADRLFANRFIKRVANFRQGAQQNKIYIFVGAPGSGKTTFISNLLKKFEEYTSTKEGITFETIWRINENIFGETSKNNNQEIEIPCPSHDHPIIIIPKNYRAAFLDKLLKNDQVKYRAIANEKEYEWVFEDEPCTICRSLFWALFEKLRSIQKVLNLVYARASKFDRRLGEGISVFNPGDLEKKQTTITDKELQERINRIFGTSNAVHYIFSKYARTNNGIFVLMDIKDCNEERLKELHNIISEGVHRVDNIEEGVTSLFIAVMNPEDKEAVLAKKSFIDRIEFIAIPYVMEVPVEAEIYRKIFGKHIDTNFLPRVLDNFARVIVSTRLLKESKAIKEWIKNPEKYKKFCDEQGLLLKMSIYEGTIPTWLSEEDRRNFTAKHRRNIISEGEQEGKDGITGRDSIKIFSDFFTQYGTRSRLITMADLCFFFRKKIDSRFQEQIPEKFVESILRLYNYTVLQEVKESLYYYNQNRVSSDIQNYLFAINFEKGTTEKCNFTGEYIEITEDFFVSIENFLLGADANEKRRLAFREEIQKEYASQTLTKEIRIDNLPIISTTLYQKLLKMYTWSLKEMVLEPFLDNDNFRNAIKAHGTEEFKTYDKKIQNDVNFLLANLENKFGYTERSAKEICIYVIDYNLAKSFKK